LPSRREWTDPNGKKKLTTHSICLAGDRTLCVLCGM
jgi:hypothetical protein